MTTPAPLPNAPTNPEASASPTGVNVTFTASDNAGAAGVTTYTTLGYNLTTNEQDATATGTSPILVKSLKRNCDYAFTVIANGSSGSSAESLLSNTVQPLSTPDPPTNVVGTPGDGQVSVAFRPPNKTGGAAITSYTVTAIDRIVTANGGQQVSASGSPITVPGLTNGDGYTFSVVATNSMGNSVPSDDSPLCTPVASSPGGSVSPYPDALQFTITKAIGQVQLADEIKAATGTTVTLALRLETGVTVASGAHPGTLYLTPNTVSSSTVQTVINNHVPVDGYGLSQESQNFQRVLTAVMADPTITLNAADLQTAVRELLLQLTIAPFLSGDALNLPTNDYPTVQQVDSQISGKVSDHNADGNAHPDIRQLIGSSGSSGTGVPPTRKITAGTGLNGGGDLTADRTLSVKFGVTDDSAVKGNDARLGNSRTPTAHASTHATGGSDALTASDINAAPTNHSHFRTQGVPVTISDAATLVTDASQGTYFRASISGTRTLAVPTNPTDGQVVLWEITAAIAARTITLATGNGGFLLGNNASPTTTIAANAKMMLTAAYNAAANRWVVMSCVPTRQPIVYPIDSWTIQPSSGNPPRITLPTLAGSEIARITITDPGWPYIIEAAAEVEMQNAANTRWDIEFRLNGVASNYVRFGGIGASLPDATRTIIIPWSASNVLTGTNTLYVVGYGVGSTSTNGYVTAYSRHFLAKVLPQ